MIDLLNSVTIHDIFWLILAWYALKLLRRFAHWIHDHREATRRPNQKEIGYAMFRLADGQRQVEAMMDGRLAPEQEELQELEHVFQDIREMLLDHVVRERWPDIMEAERSTDSGGTVRAELYTQVLVELGEDCREGPPGPRKPRGKSPNAAYSIVDEPFVPPLIKETRF